MKANCSLCGTPARISYLINGVKIIIFVPGFELNRFIFPSSDGLRIGEGVS